MNDSIHQSARCGTPDAIYLAIGSGEAVSDHDQYGALPLGIAAAAGNLVVIRALLELGADPASRDREGVTAWDYAVQGGHHHAVAEMLDRADEESKLHGVVHALHAAAAIGDDALVRKMLARGAAVDAVNRCGETALLLAVRGGRGRAATCDRRLSVVQHLLESGADPNAAGTGCSPIGAAALCGDPSVFRLLVEAGAVFDLPLAAAAGDVASVRQRLALGDDPYGAGCSEGLVPLVEAAREGHAEVAALLLSQGASPHRPDAEGTTALAAAAEHATADVLAVLLSGGADPNERGYDGVTPLMLAAGCGSTVGVERLLAAGAEVDAVNRHGFTALMYAAQAGEAKCVTLLLRAGADRFCESDNGDTVFSLARASG